MNSETRTEEKITLSTVSSSSISLQEYLQSKAYNHTYIRCTQRLNVCRVH